MTKFKTNSIIYTLSLFLLVGVLAFSLALTCVRSTQNAYADYETDILNNPQAVVNFNQFVLNQYTHNATLNVEHNYIVSNLLSQQHYFYVRIDVPSSNTIRYEARFRNYDGSTSINLFNGNRTTDFVDIIQLDSRANYEYLTIYAYLSGLVLDNALCIDLTQMFGVGNEPTLQQCNNIFTSDYYNYNLGTAVAYSQMNAFAQGVNSVLTQLDTTIDITTIINNAQPYYGSYKDSFIQYYTQTGNYPEQRYTQALVFYNACYVPFLVSLETGTTIILSAESIGTEHLNSFRLGIYVQGDNGQLSLVDTLQDDILITNYQYSYSLPFTCSGIVIQNLDSDNDYFSFDFFNIKYSTDNLGNVIANSYQSGYDTAKSYYDDYYGYNGEGYNNIYNLGYSTGINASATDFANTYYTFPQFLGALFDVPVKVIISLLDFEVFGFNMKNLVFSLITLAIVFAIIRLILMKTGEK